jgi:hypothetical protein
MHACGTVLPDGIFSKQKIPIWVNFGGSCNENEILWTFGLFYCNLVYFVVILVYFSRFGVLYQEKSVNPAAT